MWYSYCLNDGYGTRFIPAGTITGAHFVKVVSDEVSYVQVTGSGDVRSSLSSADKGALADLVAVYEDLDPGGR